MTAPILKDLRRVKLYLNPENSLRMGWIPDGVVQTIVNVTDEDGEPIGELETGSDGFVKLVLNLNGKYIFAQVEQIPGRNHAKCTWK